MYYSCLIRLLSINIVLIYNYSGEIDKELSSGKKSPRERLFFVSKN